MQINAGENEKDKQTGIKKASPKRRFRDVFSICLEIQRETETVGGRLKFDCSHHLTRGANLIIHIV